MKNAQWVAKVEKRREDAHALPKLRETRRTFRRISHEVPSECDASSHRFWEAEHSRFPLLSLSLCLTNSVLLVNVQCLK